MSFKVNWWDTSLALWSLGTGTTQYGIAIEKVVNKLLNKYKIIELIWSYGINKELLNKKKVIQSI